MPCVAFDPNSVSYPQLARIYSNPNESIKGFIYLHCESGEEALREIIAKKSPKHLAFGETHHEGDNPDFFPMLYFVRNLFPVLVENQFKGGVIEGFYGDPYTNYLLGQNLSLSPQTPENLAPTFYVQTKGFRRALTELLIAGRQNQVLIWGGSLQKGDPENSYTEGDLQSPLILKELLKKIGRRMAEQILLLNNTIPGKTFSYGGGYHNDKRPLFLINGLSIRDYAILEQSYIEVDLVSPEAMKLNKYGRYDYLEYPFWLNRAVPQNGVTLVNRGNGSYAIIFPEKVLYVPAPSQ